MTAYAFIAGPFLTPGPHDENTSLFRSWPARAAKAGT